MADLKQRRTSLVKTILGHDAAPRKVVLSGMADLEKMLGQRFHELRKQREESARASAPRRAVLIDSLRKDPAWAASIRKRRARQKSLRSRRATPPKVAQRKERVFLGSLGGTRVPPFDYPWNWSASSGSPTVSKYADVEGNLDISMLTADNNSSSASARAAVDIFFSSPIDCRSNFRFWASPYVNFGWEEYCTLDSAHSDGFIGLYAASYDWSGNFTGTLIEQTISLWSNSSWWDDANGKGSSAGFSLSADFDVDSDHWYALWVWCGVDSSADGLSGTFSGSAADSDLAVAVRAISWELG
jgi:hypothetical protein